jgi:hypothetical protein
MRTVMERLDMHLTLAQVSLWVHDLHSVTTPHREDASCCGDEVLTVVCMVDGSAHEQFCPVVRSDDQAALPMSRLPRLAAPSCCWDLDALIASIQDTNLRSALCARKKLFTIHGDRTRLDLMRWIRADYAHHPLGTGLVIAEIADRYEALERETVTAGFDAGPAYRTLISAWVDETLHTLTTERGILFSDDDLRDRFATEIATHYGVERDGAPAWCAVNWNMRGDEGDGASRLIVLEAIRTLYFGSQKASVRMVPGWVRDTIQLLGGAAMVSAPFIGLDEGVIDTATTLWLEDTEQHPSGFESWLMRAELL